MIFLRVGSSDSRNPRGIESEAREAERPLFEVIRHMTRGLGVSRGAFVPYGRFGRLFPNLSPGDDSPDLALKLGHPRGPLGGAGGWNFNIPAGFTYLGQFIDHDLSFDPTSDLERKNDPKAIQNFRTAAFELDSIYGAGNQANPFFYDPKNRNRFRLGADKSDLPRLNDGCDGGPGTAVIADPRNDVVTFLLSQLHVAFLNFHNFVVAQEEQRSGRQAFERAQRLVRWHYQWIVLKEYLPLIVDQNVIDQVKKEGRRFFHWTGHHPFMPVEFSVAAFRFGHVQIRETYDIAQGVQFKSIPVNKLFGPNKYATFKRAVDWTLFFPFDGKQYQLSRPLGFRMARALLDLSSGKNPHRIRAQSVLSGEDLTEVLESPELDRDETASLAYLDLRRGQSFDLPPGTSVAFQIGLPADQILEPAEAWRPINKVLIKMGKPPVPDDTSVPLWLYILIEARKSNEGRPPGTRVFGEGKRLGPVGSRIVTEVIFGLLEGDSESFLAQEPSWRPTLPAAVKGQFTITDLLRLAEEGKKI